MGGKHDGAGGPPFRARRMTTPHRDEPVGNAPAERPPFGWSSRLEAALPAGPTPGSPGPGGVERAAIRLAGIRPGDRAAMVRSMVLVRRRESAGYWLNLLLSAGIATLGLALGSTAVVIGAMLVSPLMGPIVELGMGLVTGSPVLTLRSLARAGGGMLVVVLAAALLSLLLPFQEITSEIAARTSPTVLDLIIAVFVAVVAAISTVRPRSDAASTAAGTAIGISLVPPLCVAGFGVGTGNGEVAIGASLLFLTNFTAIVAVAVVCFLALGFEHVNTGDWDRRALRTTRGRGIRRAAEVLRSVFGSRYSRVIRVGIPVALVAMVSLPLADALRQVAWEVRARTAVSRGLAAVPAGDIVQSAVTIRARSVNVRLYLIGTHQDAASIQRALLERVRRAVPDSDPVVRVVAVPVASAPDPDQPVADPIATLAELISLRERMGDALTRVWPATGGGPMVRWEIRLGTADSITVVPTHLGAPLAAGTRGLLATILLESSGIPVAVRTHAIPDSIAVPAARMQAWDDYLAEAGPLLSANRSLQLCLDIPAAADPAILTDRIAARLARAAPGQVQGRRTGSRFVARLSLFAEAGGPCTREGTAG